MKILVVIQGAYGERIVENVHKGTRLLVTGRVENRSWEDKDGNKRTSMEMTAQIVGLDIKFTDYVKKESGGYHSQPAGGSPSGQPVTESPF